MYYVVQRSVTRQPIFQDDAAYRMFEQLLAEVVENCRARVHAYCWMADSVRLIVEISDVPVGRLMQRVTSRYAREVHRRRDEQGPLFRPRYRALLIDPDAYLLKLARCLHWAPVHAGLTGDPAAYRWSSHPAYLEPKRVPAWLYTHVTIHKLAHRRDVALRAYAQYMRERPDPDEARQLERGASTDPRVLGDTDFLETLPRSLVVHRSRTSLDEIIDAVARIQGVERGAMLSKSRKRNLTLARALVAWHATQRGISTLTEVGRRLNRDPSTLFVAIERYTKLHPELFALTALKGVGPLLRRVV
jgi:REP element-mobilizing transposase RayT